MEVVLWGKSRADEQDLLCKALTCSNFDLVSMLHMPCSEYFLVWFHIQLSFRKSQKISKEQIFETLCRAYLLQKKVSF